MSEDKIIAEIITLIRYKNKDYEVRDLINYLCEELVKKDNIIKEVREYIKSNEKEYGSLEDNEKIILEILKKENKNVE